MTKLLKAALGALLLATACTTRDTTDPWNNPPAAADSLVNISYDSDTSQKMDVYLPVGRGVDSTPVLVLLHGGDWMSGDKSDMRAWVAQLRSILPNYALANVNYRLGVNPPVNAFPAQETDIQNAISYIYDHTVNWHVSRRFILVGYSAGGHLALLHSYKRAHPLAIEAVASFSGASDLPDYYDYQPANQKVRMQYLMNGSPVSNAVLYDQSSPRSFVGAHTIPTFLVHGGLDSLVPYRQSDALKAQLDGYGIPNSYIFYPDVKHIYADTTRIKAVDSLGRWLKARIR